MRCGAREMRFYFLRKSVVSSPLYFFLVGWVERMPPRPAQLQKHITFSRGASATRDVVKPTAFAVKFLTLFQCKVGFRLVSEYILGYISFDVYMWYHPLTSHRRSTQPTGLEAHNFLQRGKCYQRSIETHRFCCEVSDPVPV